MKKFLSLVLAVIMTMSLVTISASAAEYKDFTDKDEIQYEEAVAVLNRLGIITGYSEGDFRPEGELTRGAAAKIIASLLIGPEAAENLSPTTAPFKDVPLDHTFAGPIAYCSTLKIINGYSDGSFQPGGTLTGYAFSKMLLGALGYDGDLEGFTGAGWNMNVMRLGGEAGLFDRISFKGNEPVNREQAAQLALNTLKGTLVEYTGGLNVTAGDASVTSKPQRNYKTSNQEFAAHINNKKAGGQLGTAANALYTVEFGEEHFVDLRMTHDRNTYDDFGRPSNEWSYKKVTIGTFPIEADKVYTEQVAHDVATVTNASKARSLGLTGFEVLANRDHGATTVTVNGKVESTKLADVGEIADYTDNGTLVEVYVDEDNADWVKNVVVVKTQLMEVKRLGKDSVSLDLYDNGSANKGKAVIGFNQKPIDEKVNNVEVDDAYYTLLSGLKIGDLVAVVPVTTDDGDSYTVAKAYVPETASGKLNKVSTYGNGNTVGETVNTIGVTVGDTAYDVALWNKDLADIDANKLDVTTKDVTLTLDEYGNAMLAKDVGATSDFMVVGSYYQSLVNGKLVTYVKGWDISGEELTLNLGSSADVTQARSTIQPGDLAYYTNSGTSSNADWRLSEEPTNGVFDVQTGTDADSTASPKANYAIKASNSRILLKQAYKGTVGADYVSGSTEDFKPWIHKNIKFIYVTFESDSNDVESIEIKNGVQAASNSELNAGRKDSNGALLSNYNTAQAAVEVKDGTVKPDGTVKAVVIKNESNDAVATNMLYIVNYEGSVQRRSDDGELVYEYTVAMNGSSGIVDDEMTIYSTKKLNRGDWARYTEVKDDNFENFYNLSRVNQQSRATSTMEANFSNFPTSNKALVQVNSTTLKKPNGGALTAADIRIDEIVGDLGAGDNNAAYLLNLRYARWVDLTGNGMDSYDDLYDLTQGSTKEFNLNNVRASMIYNDDPSKDNFRQVSMIVILSTGATTNGGSENSGTEVNWKARLNSRGEPFVDFVVTRPSWADADAKGTLTADLYIDGAKTNWTGAFDTASGSSSTITGRGDGTADSADDVSIRNIKVVWDKVVVKAEDAEALPADVTVTNPIAKGATSINVKIPATVSARAADDVTAAYITVKEGSTVLKARTALDVATAQGESGQNVTLDEGKAVSGTAAITVKVELITGGSVEPTTYTATVTAPAGWTAVASKTSGIAADEKITVTYTKSENGEFTPKATVDSTKITGATVTAATTPATNPAVTPGTASAAAKVVLTLTVTGNVTVSADAIDLSAAGSTTPTTYTLSLGTATLAGYTFGAPSAAVVAGGTITFTVTKTAYVQGETLTGKTLELTCGDAQKLIATLAEIEAPTAAVTKKVLKTGATAIADEATLKAESGTVYQKNADGTLTEVEDVSAATFAADTFYTADQVEDQVVTAAKPGKWTASVTMPAANVTVTAIAAKDPAST